MYGFRTGFIQYLCLIQVFLTGTARCDCVPEFTDDCFMDVQKDLDQMIDNRKNVLLNATVGAISDLCLSLMDAIKCCSDIIDTDCEDDPRRDNMDGWVLAFQMTFNHVCISHREDLHELLLTTSCWSLERFLECVRDEANLTKVEYLFFTPLDSPEECRLLRNSFHDCSAKATVSSCREEDNSEIRKRVLQLFLDEAQCSSSVPLLSSFLVLLTGFAVTHLF